MNYGKRSVSHRKLWVSLSAILALFTSLTPVWGQGEARPEEPYLMAQGQGEVSVKPDVAQIQIGVRTDAKEVSEAVQGNATRMDAVIKAVRAAGVEEKDVTTVGYSIVPLYEPPKPDTEQKQRGYQVNNMVRVTVRKIADAGKILDTATQAGANAARGISFDLSDDLREKAYAEALTKAVKEARQKVVTIAKATEAGNITLHSVIEQGSGSVPQPMAMFRAEARGVDTQTPIVAGQMTVSASVTVRYTSHPGIKANY